MPSTDLSRQLAGISSKSKKHASNYSLLFKQAADVDSDSVFGLAKNGMAELKLMDFDTFKPYDDTLFSEHWKDGGDIALQVNN